MLSQNPSSPYKITPQAESHPNLISNFDNKPINLNQSQSSSQTESRSYIRRDYTPQKRKFMKQVYEVTVADDSDSKQETPGNSSPSVSDSYLRQRERSIKKINVQYDDYTVLEKSVDKVTSSQHHIVAAPGGSNAFKKNIVEQKPSVVESEMIVGNCKSRGLRQEESKVFLKVRPSNQSCCTVMPNGDIHLARSPWKSRLSEFT